MASFTDNVQQLTNFTPYIQQQPLDMMAKVGMYKQGQYDQGIEKIQKSFDTIAGMQVSSKHKAYLQSKLNEMGNQMKVLGASDFSNGSLVNSTTSQINSIANDEIVQTGIQAALRQKKEYEFIEKAREKGELTPAHLANFQKQNNAWEQDDNLKKSYSAKYTNFFDADKLVIENIGKILPAGTSIDYIFEMEADNKTAKKDAQGNYIYSKAMTRLKKEGRMPEDVEKVIEMTFNDPRVQQEMRIRGEYTYSSYKEKDLANVIVKSANNEKNKIEQEIDNQNVLLSFNPDSAEIKERIEKLNKSLENTRTSLDNNVQLILSNPEQLKSNLYNSQIKNTFLEGFSNVKTSVEMHKNEAYSQFMEENRFEKEFAQKQNEFKYTMQNNAANREQTGKIAEAQLTLGYKKLEAEINKNNKSTNKNSGNSDSNDGIVDGSAYQPDFKKRTYDPNALHDASVLKATTNFANDRRSMLWEIILSKNTQDKAIYEKMIKNGTDPQIAIEKIISDKASSQKITNKEYTMGLEAKVLTQFSKGNGDSSVSNVVKNYNTSRKIFLQQTEIDKAVSNNDLKTYVATLEKIPYTQKNLIIGGKTIQLNQQDVMNGSLIIAAKQGFNRGPAFLTLVNQAKKELKDAGKEFLIGVIENNASIGYYTNRDRSGKKRIGKGNNEIKQDAFDKLNPVKKQTYDALFDMYNYADKLDRNVVKIDTEKRGNFIKKIREIKEDVYAPLFRGSDPDKKDTNDILNGMVTSYSNFGKTEGEGSNTLLEDYKKAKTQAERENQGLNVKIEFDDNQNKNYYVTNNKNNKWKITEGEAIKLDPSIKNVFNPDPTDILQSMINSNFGQSSKGILTDNATFDLQSTALETDDFKSLSGTNYKAKVIIKQNPDKTYYPYMQFSNGGKPVIVTPKGNGYISLNALLTGLKETISPSEIQKHLK